ncbi:MAG: 4-hydroxythreonine-4-phosphate dehydrogenase PdxA [Roseiarcus sp.]
MTAPSSRRPVALTMGDPAGIGPELVLRAWIARASLSSPFFALADPKALGALARRLGLEAPIAEVSPAEASAAFARALPVVALSAPADARPGEPDPTFAAATIESSERAVGCGRSGQARALVTNPIAKATLYQAGFKFPGHTEYLGALAERWGAPAQPVMMIWSRALAVVPVTIHVALSEVPRLLTRKLIVSTARIVAADMKRRFGLARPRLALAGLNPHAGEGGAMGREEIETIAPAIAELSAEGLDDVGPLPADTMFHAAARARYDVALTMYHDQGLIPAKTLAFDTGVNVTLGLPFVRTSPDHGTAFDIAGKGLANPTSLIEALRLAARLAP